MKDEAHHKGFRLSECFLFSRTPRQPCSCRVGPCALLVAASLTSSRVWVTRCPAATLVTPATAASSMPSATAAAWATPAHHDVPDGAPPERHRPQMHLVV